MGRNGSNKFKSLLTLVMVTMLTTVDIAPLYSYAIDAPDEQETNTIEPLTEDSMPQNKNSIISEESSSQDTVNPEEGTELAEEGNLDTVNPVEEDSQELTEATKEEVIEGTPTNELPSNNVEEEGTDKTKEEISITKLAGEEEVNDTKDKPEELATTSKYTLATDSDFSGTGNGNFRYIGNDEYVEIPHTIKGVNVISYTGMFKGTKVKGVKSTNRNVVSMAEMFIDMETTTLDVSELDTTSVVTFQSMFLENVRDIHYLTKLTGIENFNTSNATNMSAMFSRSFIKNLNLRNFNTSKVTSMASMFNGASMVEVDVGSFDTSKVESFYSMFYNFGGVIKGVGVFDTRSATTMNEMFYSTYGTLELDVSRFNTSKVRTMDRMFYGSGARLLDVSSFDTTQVISMGNMFQNSQATEIKGLENFNTSKVTNMLAMFSNTKAKRLDLSSFDTTHITNMVSMFDTSKAMYIDVSSFDTSKVTNMSGMFQDSRATEIIGLTNFNTSRVTDMNKMFKYTDAQVLDLRSFDTRKVTNMDAMFYDAYAKEIRVTSFDTTYVTSMENMFINSQVNELDLSSFDMRSVNKTDNMLQGAVSNIGLAKTQGDADKLNKTINKPAGLTFKPKYITAKDEDFIGTINGSFKYIGKEEYVELPHKIRGINVTSYKNMFENTSVKGIISTNKNITDMSGMFKGNTSTELDVSNLDTTSVTNMNGMFLETKATSLDLRNFITVNVKDMGSIFKYTQANELDLGSFDLSKVINTTNMFQNANATKGYARTNEDLEKINQSTNKPTTLEFKLWGMTVKQTPMGWTNGDVNLEVDSISGGTAIKETELVNNSGENLLSKDIFNINSYVAYTGAKITKTDNVSVPEWNTKDAKRLQSVRGNGDFQLYWNMTNTTPWLGKRATHSVYIENKGKYPITLTYNGLEGAPKPVIQPGFSGRVVNSGSIRTSHDFMQFSLTSSGDMDVNVWGFKLELGDSVTDYSPPIDKSTAEQGVYPVYSNGTYILRATDENGDTRTVAHTVSNIDRVNPTAELKKSTEGWTSQDVTIYATATDNLSGVKSITLPDGKVVNAEKAEYIAKENKEYAFTIEDNAGNKETVKTNVTNIDRSRPSLTASVDNKYWTRDPVNITVTSEQSTSGLTDIIMKSSPWEGRNLVLNSDEYIMQGDWKMKEYRHNNGTNLGNIRGKKVSISMDVDIANYKSGRIGYEPAYSLKDEVEWGGIYYLTGTWFGESSKGWYGHGEAYKPVFNGRIQSTHDLAGKNIWYAVQSGIYNQVNADAVFKVGRIKYEIGSKATPWTPAPEDIKLINNTKTFPVVANGLYTFEATYNNGTTSEASVNVSNIDLDAPTATAKGNPTEYTESEEVTIELTAKDGLSGMRSITLPDKKVVSGSSAVYKVKKNGNYDFILEDNVGNKTTHTVKVDKMMMGYSFYIYDSKGKPLKGAVYDLLRDGVVHSSAESDANGLVNFGKVPSDGKYTIKQTKAPDGFVVNPDEKEVEVGDTTEPEEFISYPRGDTLPATGTLGLVGIMITVSLIGLAINTVNKKRKG